jgi:DNA gyrase subunit A
LEYIKGPDFPIGGIVYNQADIAHAYTTGRGGVVCRGEAEIVELKNGSFQIIITSIPFRVNKTASDGKNCITSSREKTCRN